ncbi:Ohr family peroxiredoxin [Methylobacterium nonmethylotrophicum]|uniref:Ohr family peroxiredoxin n=1 Tax=Methylobacterium nonmethylotrophicum TaxID=1141884 RepID=A0A4Z0NIF4_9HYPH|nr:Ohr family peroxiredoxin [Methylobacterium nonmethylotrophicum]TGD95263.1 Ohr family peroxiredoxin [Methylobacterium nonmethylotrophicum]
MKDLYVARTHVEQGRDGVVRSDDGQLDVRLAFPAALGGSGQGTNPEQLFAAGFSACFASAVRFAAGQKKLDAGAVTVDTEVTLFVREDGRYGLRADFAVKAPGLSTDDVDAVIAEAKRICAYTNATAGHVETRFLVSSSD